MAIEAIDHNDAGVRVVPETWGDWEDWVAATATRNWCDEDPLLDWLTRYGVERGFVPDDLLPDYDERLDFTKFLFAQGLRFEAAVLTHLETLVPLRRIARGGEPGDIRSFDCARETFEAMFEGVPIVVQGVLRNPETRTYGAADLLIRSDVLAELFPGTITLDEAAVAAPELDGPWHYRVVDIKFTTLHLDRAGHAGSEHLTYMAQTYIYNEALGRMQGYLAPHSYLLGRGWEKGKERGQSCMERLAPIAHERAVKRRHSVGRVAEEAAGWMRRLRAEGGAWSPLPEPSVPELRPNAGNGEDQPWHAAKLQIARQIEELTLLWQVGVKNRRQANAEGIYRWTDPACTARTLGITGEKKPDTLDRLIAINRSSSGAPVEPARVHAAENEWRPTPPLEFYVDFETVSNLADDFSRIPGQNGQPLIFMVGCGHMEDGAWEYRCFIADQLLEPAEAAMLDDWFAHMRDVTNRLAPGSEPRVFHWSPAETSTLETAYQSAAARHPEKQWPRPNWFDFLKKVVREEPVVVRGAMGFGLKAVANAMQSHGLIETEWPGGVVDGLGAMLGAWRCAEEAALDGRRLEDLLLMQSIATTTRSTAGP
jgi:hypothetical protein